MIGVSCMNMEVMEKLYRMKKSQLFCIAFSRAYEYVCAYSVHMLKITLLPQKRQLMPSLVISYWLVQGVTHMLKINENAMLVKAHYSRSLYSEGIFRQVLATHGTYQMILRGRQLKKSSSGKNYNLLRSSPINWSASISKA